MKYKKVQLVDHWNAFSQLGEEKVPIKFAYMLARNRKLIEDEVMTLKVTQDKLTKDSPPEEHAAYVELLSEEVEVEFITCVQADLPKEINSNFLSVIIDLIN